MSNDLPDKTDELKQYIEYLLDCNQFLEQELTESEKEKIQLAAEKSGTDTGIRTVESREELKELTQEIKSEANELKEFSGSNEDTVLKAANLLRKMSLLETYLKNHQPSVWQRRKERHRESRKSVKKVIQAGLQKVWSTAAIIENYSSF